MSKCPNKSLNEHLWKGKVNGKQTLQSAQLTVLQLARPCHPGSLFRSWIRASVASSVGAYPVVSTKRFEGLWLKLVSFAFSTKESLTPNSSSGRTLTLILMWGSFLQASTANSVCFFQELDGVGSLER